MIARRPAPAAAAATARPDVWRYDRARLPRDDAPQPGEFVLGESFATILTETTQSLVCVYDSDGRIVFFNDACERATGFRREEIVGRDACDFVIPAEE